jgi:hypothetical protein
MPEIPRRVRATPPVHVGPNTRVWYQPANTRRDLPRTPGGQSFDAMDAYLLSDDLQKALNAAGDDMVNDAQELTREVGAIETGAYLSSFRSSEGPIVEVNDGSYSNPRRSVEVGNDDPSAAANEWGNSRRPRGYRILGKVAAQYDNPKGGA